jgi:hypothetical protein
MAQVIFSHPYVEDYIEIIAGHRKPDGSNPGLFDNHVSILSLARYDVNMVQSLASQSSANIGYTDRQAPLALNIALKYERQLAKAHISIEPLKNNPQYRIPIRTLDRSVRVWLENETIKMRFPFDAQRIEALKSSAKESCGTILFNREEKVWEAALTEYNVNWAVMFARANNFEIESSLQEVMDIIFEAEKKPYAIELQAKDKLEINNASSTLVDYINEKLGGFELDNLLTLVDNAPVLGYTLEKVISDTVEEAYGTRFHTLCTHREMRANLKNPTTDQVKAIIDYARETKRFPIALYEPDGSDKLAMLIIRNLGSKKVVDLDKNPNADLTDVEFVHTRKIPRVIMKRIPLLISSAGMMFGGDRQIWLETAEKIVYFVPDVYSKTNKKGREVCVLD